MDVSGVASAVPREGMNDLYQKIEKYVYEIRMIELDEYLYGMNKKKIDGEKVKEIIMDTHVSESNPITNFWKPRIADGLGFKWNGVKMNQWRAYELYRKAVDLNIEQMAENGDRYACTCLGEMYHDGKGVTLNHSRAVKWYRRAAEQEYACAQWYLGEMYGKQYSVNKDYVKAFDWYRKAAEQGHADAQYSIGLMYHYGHGVDKNVSTEVDWYRKAAKRGHVDAQLSLEFPRQAGIDVVYEVFSPEE